MPAKPYTQQLRPCQGPCGRMTRNTKMSKAKYPGTVVRSTATHCNTCHHLAKKAGQELVAPPAQLPAEVLAAKEKAAAARLAAAHRARQTIEAQRAARQRLRIPRRVGLGQAMVRI